MNANSAVRVKVEGGGDQVVAHVGLHALGAFADRLGLGHSLSARIRITGERMPLHDRGKVLVQAMLMLAGGRGGVRRHRGPARPAAPVRIGAIRLDAVPHAAGR